MNKSKILIVLLVVFSTINFTSCVNEPVDPMLLNIVPEATCAMPGGLSVSNFVGTSVNLVWTASEGSSWEIQYGLHGFVPGTGTSVTATTPTKTINGLTITNDYDFYVRTNCDNGHKSDWVGPVAVGSSVTTCTTPINLAAVRSATITQQATITWTQNGDENSWQIQYGATGFVIGAGTTVSSSTPSTIITGLADTSGYDFYVRSKCSDTSSSSWAGPVHINAVGAVTSGDYYPLALNNVWNYNNGTGVVDYKIISVDNIGGLTYYKLNRAFTAAVANPFITDADVTVQIQKANGDYSQRTAINKPETISSPGITIDPFTLIFLKDYLSVGQSFSQTVTLNTTTTFMGTSQVQSQTITYTTTIMEKTSNVLVNGVTTDVIKTKLVNSANPSEIDYYRFAKNIGPYELHNSGADLYLTTYTLF